MRAIGVDVKTSNGLVGTLHDGDHVDVYAQIGTGNQRIVRKVLTNVLVLHAQIGQKDSTAVAGDAHILFALSDRDSQKMLWLAENGDDNFWLAQRPLEGAINSPPTVETLQTVLGDGLPPAIQKLIKGLLNPAGATQ
jgi:Flp pilus assembly protein CpaB